MTAQSDLLLHHASDCAVHSEPAFPAGPCNCPAKYESLRRDLALTNEIPLYAIPDDATFTLDQHLAFQRLTDAVPALLDAAERPTTYTVGYDDALQWVLDNITALDDGDRERIEAMRSV